jgi:hypothetical protein
MNPPPTVANAVHVIFPYRHPQDQTLWVFDDPRFGLREEAFVFGASEAIERLVAEKLGGADKLKVIFSTTPLPDADRVLQRVGDGLAPEANGCRYHDGTAELWLCPAMTHYLPGGVAPERIFVKVGAV